MYIYLEPLIKLSIAGFLAGIIGFERDMHGRSAGLRTHILVSMGAALYTIVGLKLCESFSVDPTRIIAQIVTGIGFLGTGVIIKTGMNVVGLTTAGCIWMAAAIGTCSAIGYYPAAIIATIISVFVITILNQFEKLYRKTSWWILSFSVPQGLIESSKIKSIINKRKDLDMIFIEQKRDNTLDLAEYFITLKIFYKGKYKDISDEFFKQIQSEISNIKKIKLVKIKNL